MGAKYTDKKVAKKKEFSPDLTIILFEEPEAFLHPSQQEILNSSLEGLSEEESQQILATTHSNMFVSKNVRELPRLIKVHKTKACTECHYIPTSGVTDLFDQNNSMFQMFLDKLSDTSVAQQIKNKINSRHLADPNVNLQQKLEEESLKYFLWLDAERSNALFAKHVIICEGASERTFLNYLIKTKWRDLETKHIYILDAMGKYNIHRYMNLFGRLGMSHSALYDSDVDKGIHELINDFLNSQKNSYTKQVYAFDDDFESFLGITSVPQNRHDLKPVNVIWSYSSGKITDVKITELRVIIDSLL